MNNFYSTTFQNFHCGLPRIGLEDRKNSQKAKKKTVFWKKFQNFNVCACLSRLDEKKKNFEYTLLGIFTRKLDQN
jgi:hypothetical protein